MRNENSIHKFAIYADTITNACNTRNYFEI